MNHRIFGDDIDPSPLMIMFWIVVLALLFRFGILALNLHWDFEPYWGLRARTALVIAWSDFGMQPLPDGFGEAFNVSPEKVLQSWLFNDRGLNFLYVFMHKIFGGVTYVHIQIFHLFMDALIVVPVMWLSNRIAGKKGAVVSGVIYALFLPQAQMAVSPNYNSWLGDLMVIMTWLTAMLIEAKQKSKFIALLCALIVVNFIGNEFRSVVALFSFGAAGWFWLVSIGVHRTLLLPAERWTSIIALAATGVVVILLSSTSNYIVRGEYSPVRSSFGHNFFTGVGQFENPINMRDSDAAPVEWYARETGITDTNSTVDPAYNMWLNEQAKKFISDYPVLYTSMVLRRALRILFPNMAFTLVTDLPSYTLLPSQLEAVEMRKSLVKKHGWLSKKLFVQLIKNDPAYVFGLGWRVLLLIILPVGLLSAICLARSRAAAVFFTLPLAYSILTLSFVYVTPPVVTGIHAAVLSVSTSGLYLLFRHIKDRFKGTHIYPHNSVTQSQ